MLGEALQIDGEDGGFVEGEGSIEARETPPMIEIIPFPGHRLFDGGDFAAHFVHVLEEGVPISGRGRVRFEHFGGFFVNRDVKVGLHRAFLQRADEVHARDRLRFIENKILSGAGFAEDGLEEDLFLLAERVPVIGQKRHADASLESEDGEDDANEPGSHVWKQWAVKKGREIRV